MPSSMSRASIICVTKSFISSIERKKAIIAMEKAVSIHRDITSFLEFKVERKDKHTEK